MQIVYRTEDTLPFRSPVRCGVWLTLGVVLIVAVQIAGQAQRESGQGAMSSGVIGWWMTHPEDAGTSALDLLILWRGTPGWLFRAGGIGANASGRQGFGSNTGTQTVWAGDRALTWTDVRSDREDHHDSRPVLLAGRCECRSGRRRGQPARFTNRSGPADRPEVSG
jgi:hypothetical protein